MAAHAACRPDAPYGVPGELQSQAVLEPSLLAAATCSIVPKASCTPLNAFAATPIRCVAVVALTWRPETPHAAAAAAADPAGACVVGEWGPFTPCTRIGLHQWAHSHTRSVQQPELNCPATTETEACGECMSQTPTSAFGAKVCEVGRS